MTIQRMVGIAFFFALASGAMGQQPGRPETPKLPQQTAVSSTVVRSYPARNATSLRSLQTRTESPGREVITETVEVPGTDGSFKTFLEVATETVGTGSDSLQTKRDVFGTDADGRRKLIQTTQADQQVFPGGTSQVTENTWTADLDGHLELSQRQLEETKSVGPDVKQVDRTMYRAGINEALRETERVQQTERRVSPDLLQNETTRSVPDGNGRWQAVETRNQEVRSTGPAESLEEETVQRPDTNGVLKPAERKVTLRSTVNGEDQVITETYSQFILGLVGRGDNALELAERIRLATVAMPDGGRQTIQEVERRNPVAPNEPLRLVERTVETLRPIAPDRWETQRQVFAPDGNGRLVLIFGDAGEAAGK